VLEVLREPLESGRITISRAARQADFPARFQLVAAMNPCPCGYFNVPGRRCTCQENRVFDYHARVSGPLLDRIDITLQTRPVEYHHIARADPHEPSSAYYRERVEAARERQRARFRDVPGVHCNAQMPVHLLRRHCTLTPSAEAMLEKAVLHFGLSARAHDRILKLALSRADLEGHARIKDEDMRIAIDCRMLDRKGWLHANTHGGTPGRSDSFSRYLPSEARSPEEP
jgi:magnesium chelatase family protein